MNLEEERLIFKHMREAFIKGHVRETCGYDFVLLSGYPHEHGGIIL